MAAPGRNLAFLVGSSHYTGGGRQLPDLPAAVNDVAGLGRLLSEPPSGIFDSVTRTIDPTSRLMLRQLSQFIAGVEKDDLALIYFSGHGKVDALGRLYLATRDTRVSSLDSTAFPVYVLRELLAGCRSPRTVIILDCCQSGKASSGLAKGDSAELQQITDEGRGQYVLTSSGAYESSWIPDRAAAEADQRSIFTDCLVEGISSEKADLNKDGFIDIEELARYAGARTTERRADQRPLTSKFGAQGEPPAVARTRFRGGRGSRSLFPAVTGSLSVGGRREGGNAYEYESIHLMSAWSAIPDDAACAVALMAGVPDKGQPALRDALSESVDVAQSGSEPDAFTAAMAGLLAGRDEGGFLGVAPFADLVCYQVADEYLRSTDGHLVMALGHAVEHGHRLICLPFDSPGGGPSELWERALRRARGAGLTVVLPAGNDGGSTPGRIAASGSCVVAAAVDREDRILPFSNFGEWVSVCAPGDGILSPEVGDGYRRMSGTSFSCAIVTGVLALALAVCPDATPDELTRILVESADDISHQNPGLPAGAVPRRVNACRTVLAARGLRESKG